MCFDLVGSLMTLTVDGKVVEKHQVAIESFEKVRRDETHVCRVSRTATGLIWILGMGGGSSEGSHVLLR